MKKTLGILMLCMVFITGCSNSTSDNSYIEQGKTATIDIAKEYFTLALEEKTNHTEAKALCDKTDKLIEAIKLSEESKFQEAINICDEINDIDSKTDVVRNASNKLKEECNSNMEVFVNMKT